ncbi:MAG: TIGR04283 family arsenosugar biosynthesis glycosyltransferase [Deltaproteobacteria bacterium]|nr:TIGR04283 family arsenosugar biosynthesis glycosyltransferase [Deltaproteobacteria bacterium]
MGSFSVVIPALDEEANIERAVRSADGAEVIVADAGSSDGTVKKAKALGAKVISAKKGRGAQMDEGAKVATGDVLIFLHADARLPGGWAKDVSSAIERGFQAGMFSLGIDAKGFSYRLIEFGANLRARALKIAYGDQALFVTRQAFTDAGGFNGLPIMEDLELIKRLKKAKTLCILKEAVTVSPRRWQRDGVLKRTLRNWGLFIDYFFRRDAAALYKRYYS